MDIGEVMRIGLIACGVLIFCTLLTLFVRERSSRREQALAEMAAKYGLKYTPGGKDFFQGSWPGKVAGEVHGRKLTFQYTNKPFLSPRGFMAANYWADMEIAVKNPAQGSLSLQTGNSQDSKITSQPEAFATSVLRDAPLRQRLGELAAKSRGRVNVIRTGKVAFSSNQVFRNSGDLVELVDALNKLADAVEAQPARS